MLLSDVHIPDSAPAPAPLADVGIYVPMLYRPDVRPEPPDNNGPDFSQDGYFYTLTDPRMVVGDCVYAKSPTVVGIASASMPLPVIGICVKKTASNQGIVQRYGTVRNLYTNLLPQTPYFLGLDGGIIPVPIEDDAIVYAQRIGTGLSSTELYLQPNQQIYKRSPGDENPSPDSVNVEPGPPVLSRTYPSENVYIDQLSGDWYTMPVGADGASHFYTGLGAPSSSVTYEPKQIFIDENTGAYYVSPDDGSTFVPISAGEGAPSGDNPNRFRNVYIDQSSGKAFYG